MAISNDSGLTPSSIKRLSQNVAATNLQNSALGVHGDCLSTKWHTSTSSELQSRVFTFSSPWLRRARWSGGLAVSYDRVIFTSSMGEPQNAKNERKCLLIIHYVFAALASFWLVTCVAIAVAYLASILGDFLNEEFGAVFGAIVGAAIGVILGKRAANRIEDWLFDKSSYSKWNRTLIAVVTWLMIATLVAWFVVALDE